MGMDRQQHRLRLILYLSPKQNARAPRKIWWSPPDLKKQAESELLVSGVALGDGSEGPEDLMRRDQASRFNLHVLKAACLQSLYCDDAS